jgi:hypothetical protein
MSHQHAQQQASVAEAESIVDTCIVAKLLTHPNGSPDLYHGTVTFNESSYVLGPGKKEDLIQFLHNHLDSFNAWCYNAYLKSREMWDRKESELKARVERDKENIERSG